MGNLRRVSSDKERRAFRKLHELHADNEVSPWNCRLEDKAFSKVDSEVEKEHMHGTNNSCYRQKSMPLDKHLVNRRLEAEVRVSKNPAVEKYRKKEVTADKIEEVKKVDACTDVDQNNSRDKVLNKHHHEKETDDDQSVPVEDKKRFLEMLAKMEKRRERFKQSVSLKKESNLDLHHVLNQESATGEVKQRPIRKRRWCGS